MFSKFFLTKTLDLREYIAHYHEDLVLDFSYLLKFKSYQDHIFRPLSMREIKEEAKDILYMDEISHECTLLCPPGKRKRLNKCGKII